MRRVSSNKGGEYHGPCPGCGGVDRFHLWPDQGDHGSFWCRRCGKGGDAIQYLREFEGVGFREACAILGKDPGPVVLPGTPRLPRRPNVWQPETAVLPSAPWQAKALSLVDWSHGHLLQNREQLQWLAGRGICAATVKDSRLGWNPGEKGKDLWRHRSAWGLSEEINEKTGKPRRLWLPCGLVIPCFGEAGEILRVRIRRAEGEPRYYVVPGSSSIPLYLGRQHPVVVVVESELDAHAVFRAAGDLVGVYAIGNSSAKPDAETAARLRQLVLILVSTDFDEPDQKGHRPGTKAAAWWIDQFPQAERWPVPSGKDPGEALQSGVDLRAWILAAIPPGLCLPAVHLGVPREDLVAPVVVPAPPLPLDSEISGRIYEGMTLAGMPYLLAEDPGDVATLVRCCPEVPVFSFEEIKKIKSLNKDDAEKFLFFKHVFSGSKILEQKDISTSDT